MPSRQAVMYVCITALALTQHVMCDYLGYTHEHMLPPPFLHALQRFQVQFVSSKACHGYQMNTSRLRSIHSSICHCSVVGKLEERQKQTK